MSAHTPGPWHVSPPNHENPSEAHVSALSGFVRIYSAPLTRETKANATLISAAPDLLEALLETMSAWLSEASQGDGIMEEHGAVLARARAAIKKARGE
jgi:hypothetical protein